VTVHDVQVEKVGAALEYAAALLAHLREVGGEDGRRDQGQTGRSREQVRHGSSLSGPAVYDPAAHERRDGMSVSREAPAGLRKRLEAAGQEHLLRFYDSLGPQSRERLARRIEEVDLEAVPGWVKQYVKHKPHAQVPRDVQPAQYYPADPASRVRRWDREEYRRAGETLLRAAKVAAFTVAGGQGSRLGFEGPKGLFPAGAVTGKTLFAIFAEGLLAAGRKYGQPVPWYIMTSPLNHDATVGYFEQNGWLGLDQADVMFFRQGVMPSFEIGSGRILLAERDEPATNPDGHGGSIKALYVSGAIEDMRRRGVEHISYFQVDNPIVRVVDPLFLGLHAAAPDSSAEMSSKMVPKAGPEEKVGVFALINGRTHVVEYSDLPAELAHQRQSDGHLRFVAGSIAVHALSVEFVSRLNTDAAFSLPFHRAEKKAPCVDVDSGERIDPEKPNAVKLERFVFDALPLCRASVVMETDRIEEFAPIKNATGVDSVESSRKIQTLRAARWLSAHGVDIPRDATGEPECVLEVSPLTATEAADLNGKPLPRRIERGAKVAL
jgi:UDP-N-acetylglucosamine/UDP-N-acetylgalactosamine diphosphorylase